jgi:hypothetical protein
MSPSYVTSINISTPCGRDHAFVSDEVPPACRLATVYVRRRQLIARHWANSQRPSPPRRCIDDLHACEGCVSNSR